jgi:hypothetical protein
VESNLILILCNPDGTISSEAIFRLESRASPKRGVKRCSNPKAAFIAEALCTRTTRHDVRFVQLIGAGRGQRNLSIDNLYRIAEVLDMSLSRLLGKVENSEASKGG